MTDLTRRLEQARTLTYDSWVERDGRVIERQDIIAELITEVEASRAVIQDAAERVKGASASKSDVLGILQQDPQEALAEHDRLLSHRVWQSAYEQGIKDQRTADALQVDNGVGGYATPARQNPFSKGPS